MLQSRCFLIYSIFFWIIILFHYFCVKDVKKKRVFFIIYKQC